LNDDIPILIETLSRPFFRMVRCLYFTVEFDTPESGWALTLSGRSFPFLMLGLTGVVQASFDGQRFDNPRLIDEFIDTVEDLNGLVSLEDIWLPEHAFNSEIAVGYVYRISLRLFRSAFLFRDSRLTSERFAEELREFHNEVEVSEAETKAFTRWSNGTIERAMSAEPKSNRLRLELKRER
jgi:hypothetical protein